MAYCNKNFKTKKALKEALKKGEELIAWQPGPFDLDVSRGAVSLEGPWSPQPHTWYAVAEVDSEGWILKVK